MPSAEHPGWTSAAQPPAQSNNEDPAPLTSATSCFPQLVWQSHHWNERHRSLGLPEDPPAGEEQVGCLHWLHKLNQLRKMPDLYMHITTQQTVLKLCSVGGCYSNQKSFHHVNAIKRIEKEKLYILMRSFFWLIHFYPLFKIQCCDRYSKMQFDKKWWYSIKLCFKV